MRYKLCAISIALVAFVTFSSVGLTEELFHVHYRVDNLSEDAHNLSGTLLLNVYNTSGEDAIDLVASIPEPNRVIYDQRQIGVGDLPDGEQVEVLDQFIVPLEITEVEPSGETVTWRLEYTRTSGERHSVDVVGQEVQ